MKAFTDIHDDTLKVAGHFENVALTTSTIGDDGRQYIATGIFTPITAREIAAELIRLADLIEEETNADND